MMHVPLWILLATKQEQEGWENWYICLPFPPPHKKKLHQIRKIGVIHRTLPKLTSSLLQAENTIEEKKNTLHPIAEQPFLPLSPLVFFSLFFFLFLA